MIINVLFMKQSDKQGNDRPVNLTSVIVKLLGEILWNGMGCKFGADQESSTWLNAKGILNRHKMLKSSHIFGEKE